MSIPLDKKKHFVAGALIAIVLYAIGSAAHWYYTPAIAILGALGIGLAKEYGWDRYMGGTVDMMDAGWTFLGGIVATITIKLVPVFLATYGVTI